MEKSSRSIPGCRNHDRYERLRIYLYGNIPVDLVIPCCKYPLSETLTFQEGRFVKDGRFDVGGYESALNPFCRNHCLSYNPGAAPIEYVVAGTWRKCPLKCLTCFNHYEDNSKEPVLSDSEMADYLFSLGELYAAAGLHNTRMNAPPPLLQIGGSGDIFHSENYARMLSADLYKYGIDRIHIITNMQFWTERRMHILSRATAASLRKITFSVDSINRDLYEKIRQGSSWKRLLYGYERCADAFPDIVYEICYTISRLNFHEYEKAPAILKELFPKVSTITMNIARDWARTLESEALIIPKAACLDILKFCVSHSGSGYKIVYHGPRIP